MAMSGGTSYLLKSAVTNYGKGNDTTKLYLYVKQSQTPTTNQSTVYLGLYITTNYDIGPWDDLSETSYVGLATSGANCHVFDGTISTGSGKRWLVENVKYTVTHGTDGKKDITVYWKWNVNSPWGQYVYPSGSQTIKLNDIDRTAPTVSHSVSNISTNGFTISASSNVSCDVWSYSTNGGSTWTSISTASGTSKTVNVKSLTPNTSYSVKVRARKTTNYVYGESVAKEVKTLGASVLNSADSVYIDSSPAAIKINATVYDASFTHYLVYKDGSTEVSRSFALSMTAGTADRSYSFQDDNRTKLLASMSTVKTKDFTVVLETYNGTTLIGTSSKTVKLKTTAATSAPTFSGFTYADTATSAEVTKNNQILVQTVSRLTVNATAATAKNGASIVSYTASIGDKTVKTSGTSISVGAVETDGELDLIVTAVDSRGYSTSVTKKVTVLKYAKPKITKCTVRRANGIDKTIQLSFTGTMSVVKINGVDVNLIDNTSYRYKTTDLSDATDLSDYSASTSLTNVTVRSTSGTSFSYSTNELLSLDEEKSFYFRLYVRDAFSEKSFYYTIPQGTPLMAFRKGKVGINKANPEYELDVEGYIAGLLIKDSVTVTKTNCSSDSTVAMVHIPSLKFCFIRGYVKLATALNANTSRYLLTIPAEYAPASRTAISVFVALAPGTSGIIKKNEDGTGTIEIVSQKDIATSSAIYLAGFWTSPN